MRSVFCLSSPQGFAFIAIVVACPISLCPASRWKRRYYRPTSCLFAGPSPRTSQTAHSTSRTIPPRSSSSRRSLQRSRTTRTSSTTLPSRRTHSTRPPKPSQPIARAAAADATFFEPHLSLGLLLARNGQSKEAHAELTTATTLNAPDPALKARAWRALARLDQLANDPAAASTDLLAAIKLSPETPSDILLSAELAEAIGDLSASEAA